MRCLIAHQLTIFWNSRVLVHSPIRMAGIPRFIAMAAFRIPSREHTRQG